MLSPKSHFSQKSFVYLSVPEFAAISPLSNISSLYSFQVSMKPVVPGDVSSHHFRCRWIITKMTAWTTFFFLALVWRNTPHDFYHWFIQFSGNNFRYNATAEPILRSYLKMKPFSCGSNCCRVNSLSGCTCLSFQSD